MKISHWSFAFLATVAVFAQAAAPVASPPAAPGTAAGAPPATTPSARGGRGARGGQATVVVAPGTPGYPDSPMVDPAVARKDKWPVRDANNTPAPGYTARSPGNNGFYRRDANGNILPGTDLYLWAPSGHFTNYDQDDIPPYTLPDPLVMQDGRKVTSPDMWYKERRPELINLFKDNIYGRVPEDKLPKMIWEVRSNTLSDDGKTINKTIVGYFEGFPPDAAPAGGRGAGPGAGAPPAASGAPAVAAAPGVPSVPPATGPAAAARGARGGGRGFGGGGGNTITVTLALPNVGHPVPIFIGGPVNDPAGHGWGTATISGNAGVLARISPPAGQPKPGNFPGNYAISGWATSRGIDYIVTDKDVDAAHITIAGISTGGKQVLFTAAMDDRIWCVIPESSGAMGVKLNRRDIGEVVDTLATEFIANYCPNFANYIGHWNDLPTDQHEMIALVAPRKMFITGGNGELWEDVKGGFLAAVAAEPVYTLLGKHGINTVEFPPIEKPIVFGEVAFYHHNGGHMYTANERQWVTLWMEKFLNSPTPKK